MFSCPSSFTRRKQSCVHKGLIVKIIIITNWKMDYNTHLTECFCLIVPVLFFFFFRNPNRKIHSVFFFQLLDSPDFTYIVSKSKAENLKALHLWILSGMGSWCRFSIWHWGICRDKYSAEMHTGERPALHDCMNKHYFLSCCNYGLRASGWSNWRPKMISEPLNQTANWVSPTW